MILLRLKEFLAVAGLCLGSASACKPEQESTKTMAATGLTSINRDVSSEVRDYADFAQFVDGGMAFRIDFVEAFTQAWPQTPIYSDPMVRPEVKCFDLIVAVQEEFAMGTRFADKNELADFFTGPNVHSIRGYHLKIASIRAGIRKIFGARPKQGDDLRFLGLVQEMVEADVQFKQIVQDRLYEITGARGTNVKKEVVEFYDHADSLIYLRLSLEFLQRMVGYLSQLPAEEQFQPVHRHSLEMLVRTYTAVVAKKSLGECNRLLGQPVHTAAAVDAGLTALCDDHQLVVQAIHHALAAIASGDVSETWSAMHSSLNVVKRLNAALDRRLKEFGISALPAS